MTETERAYMAALIDGEGCVSMFVNNWNTARAKHGIAGRSTLVRLGVGVCDELFMRALVRRWPGAALHARRSRNPAWSTMWYAAWTGERAARVLRQVRPYLRLKRRQADLLIQWVALAHRERRYPGRGGGVGYSDVVMRRRDGYIEKMRALNRRGAPPIRENG